MHSFGCEISQKGVRKGFSLMRMGGKFGGDYRFFPTTTNAVINNAAIKAIAEPK